MSHHHENCPLCGAAAPRLVRSFQHGLDQPLLDTLQQQSSEWTPEQGVCISCLDSAHQQLLHDLIDVRGSSGTNVLPTPLRLNAHPQFTGKGVTICLIDSGFYIHPDLEFPNNRIRKMVDITNPRQKESYFRQPNDNAWHGTMTSVVCAGNGFLSDGFYKGIASEAEVVLLKVTDEKGRITSDNIVRALKWVRANHQKYNIRIVNLSVTGDEPSSFLESEVDKAIKTLHDKGIVIVAAIGNNPDAAILPPANAPEVLAVGGLDDCNTLDPLQHALYHSTYGWTVDGLLKPELIAPAIWLAAPILPGTAAQLQAQDIFEKLPAANGLERENLIRQAKQGKFLSSHYLHADGTSFAAPIVCSIIAQMLEANPSLAPDMVRDILLTTARPLTYEDRKRQGYGVIQAGHAVLQASGETHRSLWTSVPIVDYGKAEICFRFHTHNAQQVALSGDFNAWTTDSHLLAQQEAGVWEKTLPLPDKGEYRYKYVVDGWDWQSDPRNAYREPDGFSGFNSRFFI